MNKYIGIYRVLCERDDDGEPVQDALTYLIGTGGHKNTIIYRYNHDTLVLQKSGQLKTMIDFLGKNGIKHSDILDCTGEFRLRFEESGLPLVAELLSLKTTGASTNPKSIKNHPNKDAIRQEKLDSLSDDEKEKRRLSGIRLQTARESAK